MIAHARDARIDMLRGVSILLVLLHHFNIPYSLKDTGLPRCWAGRSCTRSRNGNYGVTMFFVVSGFLITRNALDDGAGWIASGLGRSTHCGRRASCPACCWLTVDALAWPACRSSATGRTRPCRCGRSMPPR